MEFEKIKDVVAEQMKRPKHEITAETRFTEDLNADSIDLLQIVTELGEIFGLAVAEDDDMDMDKIKTVGDAAEYVKNALNS
ncbi:MAG: acyl carrier protein [Defluviitaleaceae bacterium]|nr:acyl carrier protein [Defluviitaleaceae bacterium]